MKNDQQLFVQLSELLETFEPLTEKQRQKLEDEEEYGKIDIFDAIVKLKEALYIMGY